MGELNVSGSTRRLWLFLSESGGQAAGHADDWRRPSVLLPYIRQLPRSRASPAPVLNRDSPPLRRRLLAPAAPWRPLRSRHPRTPFFRYAKARDSTTIQLYQSNHPPFPTRSGPATLRTRRAAKSCPARPRRGSARRETRWSGAYSIGALAGQGAP
jgi:hypothetical protein